MAFYGKTVTRREGNWILDHDSSLLLKPSSNLELLVNQFNNATPENGNDPEKLFHLNIMTLMKCITLKYLTKINHFPYSI